VSTPSLTVAVCSRGRPNQLRATLGALRREAEAAGFEVLVVQQGGGAAHDGVRTIADPGRGLSHARNVALGEAATDWIAFVDDDCLVEPGFGPALATAIETHPAVGWVSGHVGGGDRSSADVPLVTTFPVARERLRSGRWTLPGSIGFGVFFAVRRERAQRLGGWDERLGPGVPEFPGADDMDFAYRFLRAGGAALITPRVRAVHEQWRTPEQVVALQRGYLRAWAGFAAKHLRAGDVAGGLWLWTWGAVDVIHMAKSAVGRRSGLRARLAAAKARGLAEGTVSGIRRRW